MGAMKKWFAVTLAAGAIMAGWSGVWFVVAHQTEAAIDAWIEDEKGRDRKWACVDRSIGGFPFRVRIDCASPSFKSEFGPVQSAAAAVLHASASLFSPFDIAFRADGPATFIGPGGSATFDWQTLDGLVRSKTDVSLRAQSLRVDDATGDIAGLGGSIVQEFGARIQQSPDRAPGSDAQTLTIRIDGMKAPPLDGLFQNAEPLSASLSAIILNASTASVGTLAQRLDRWSASGGRVQIGSLTAEKGPSRVDANGDLSLDERRRLSGQLSVRIAGIQPILAQLNLPAAPLAIEGLLRGSSRGNGGASLIENRTLPLELRAGRLYVGPLRTPVVLPPLI